MQAINSFCNVTRYMEALKPRLLSSSTSPCICYTEQLNGSTLQSTFYSKPKVRLTPPSPWYIQPCILAIPRHRSQASLQQFPVLWLKMTLCCTLGQSWSMRSSWISEWAQIQKHKNDTFRSAESTWKNRLHMRRWLLEPQSKHKACWSISQIFHQYLVTSGFETAV